MASTRKWSGLLAVVLMAVLALMQGVNAVLTAHASHILVDSEAEIDSIRAEIEAATNMFAKFAEVAEAKSKCPSGKRGGDLGSFTRGKMVAEFDRVVFEEEPRKLYKVQTQFGWHLVLTSSVEEDGRPDTSLKRKILVFMNQVAPFLGPFLVLVIMFVGSKFASSSGGGVKARASHILVDSEAEVDELMKQITSAKDPKAKLAELAKSKSKCPSGKGGGDLGLFGRGQMVPQFDKVVFEEEVGKVHKVQTQFGWHVVICTDRIGEKKSK
ncbi:TPA: hypothetical protein N0F65_004379 [Lagenidium giganteum]|uniref:Peptidyl-prolyl cis-trans isomerase n=1 Tax=Lagenidium giganteum TaxID=4803 RepID=A0AAV2ZI54_9STRA|nr:TPA: hypothetical protein N0F65_004379 [Lagenidium giganteum]